MDRSMMLMSGSSSPASRPGDGGRSSTQGPSDSLSAGSAVWLFLVLQCCAFWPVWCWFLTRIWENSDERWGVLALLTVPVTLAWHPRQSEQQRCSLGWSLLVTALYAGIYHVVPKLMQAGVAVTALALTISTLRFGRTLHAPTCGLLLLSLPIMPSLQFYLGYPLRVVSGAVAALLLQLGGLPVLREGTCLRWGTELVSIDAPCSGVKMLWAGLYLTCVLASAFGLGSARSAVALTGAVVGVILANAVRSAALFHLEVGTLALPQTLHEPAGLIAFAAAAIGIIGFVSRLARRTPCAQPVCLS